MNGILNLQMIGVLELNNPEIIESAAGLNFPGVYGIVHISSGRVYIGSTISIRKRVGAHRYNLRHSKHDNPLLQEAWSMFGESEFIFVLLERCGIPILTERESDWAVRAKSFERLHGFNLDRLDGRPRHCQESIERMAAAKRGKIVTPGMRRKISIALTGRKLPSRSDEHREKLRLAWLKRGPVTNETRLRLKEAWRRRKLREVSDE